MGLWLVPMLAVLDVHETKHAAQTQLREGAMERTSERIQEEPSEANTQVIVCCTRIFDLLLAVTTSS